MKATPSAYGGTRSQVRPTVLHNARVLDANWVPGDVVHRNAEKNRLRDALQPVVDGGTPQDVIIDGPSGSGKTCLARFTLGKLEAQTLDVTTGHVDCWNHSKRFRVLFDLVDEIGATHDVHRNTAQDELLCRLEELERPFVVVLDEVDQLEDKTLLRELWSIPHVTLILVSNRESDVLDGLDERVRSRFRSATRVNFDSYSHDELVAILEARVDAGFRPGTISGAQLDMITDAAAGNARDAIGFLRKAAQEADWDGTSTIEEKHIQTAIPEVRNTLRQRSLDKLSEDQRLVYDVLLEAEELRPTEIYEAYTGRADDPMTERTVRKYLSKLEHYNLVESEGRGPSRRYRAKTARV